MKKAISLLLALVLCLSLCACGKSEAVKNVEAMIDALGEITLESIDAIRSAEDAYSALTEDEQKKVGNYETLTEARDAYYELALVGEWAYPHVITWPYTLQNWDGIYNNISFVLNSDMSGMEYVDGDKPLTWSVSNSQLTLDMGGYYNKFNVFENDGIVYFRHELESAPNDNISWKDYPAYLKLADYQAYLNDVFCIVNLSEVDITDYCEPIFYDRYEYNEWGEVEDEVCTTILIKNKLADEGWLYLDSFDDVAIEVFAPKYSVEGVEYSQIETTASGCIYDSVYKLYYWLSSEGKPSCNLDISEVSLGRAKGRILYVNKEYVVNMCPDSNGGTRLLDVEIFGETIQFYAGPWLADMQN